MLVKSRAVGPIMANCYLLSEPGSPKGIVIDPGHSAESIAGWLKKEGITEVMIILTHGHFDHTNAAEGLGNSLHANILMHKADEFLLDASGDELAQAMGYFGKRPHIDSFLTDGEEIEYGNMKLKVLHTPGHSPGSICLFGEADSGPVLFSGDTLFNLGVGRTDLPGGSWRELLSNIVEKLWVLPGNTRVLPGHGPESTIDFERANNPFLNAV